MGTPRKIDEEECMELIAKCSEEYQSQIEPLASAINSIAKCVPSGRERRLNVGLFGYTRKMGEHALPRAIPFVASCYSIGMPPEILGLGALEESDTQFLKSVYINFEPDLLDAMRYYNPNTPFMPEGLEKKISDIVGEVEPVKEHLEITDAIINSIKKCITDGMSELIQDAAIIRKFMG